MQKKLTLSLLASLLFIFTVVSVSIAEEASSLTIIDMSVCQGIENREPVEIGDVFPSTIGKLYCFTRAGALEPTKIMHKWYRADQLVAEIDLKIGASPSWRTRSSKVIQPADAGNWKVDLTDEAGKVLKTVHFIIE